MVPGESKVRFKVFGSKGAKAELTVEVQGQPAVTRTVTLDGSAGEADITL